MFQAPSIAIELQNRIDLCLEQDGGAKYRSLLKKYLDLATDPFDSSLPEPRSHLGASVIGRDCAREVFFSWRWALSKVESGRMIRLFNRGHMEEPRFLALLEMVGCDVYSVDEDGKQFRIHGYRGHFGGGIDGVVKKVPGVDPDLPLLLEAKTHNDKSFKELVEKGVRAAKFTHYVQMNIYMKKLGLSMALYAAVNKNDDTIHWELVPYDEATANKYEERAEQIIEAVFAPRKLNESPSFWKCKFCDYKAVCHFKRPPDKNCRTCKFATVCDNAGWSCSVKQKLLTKQEQMAGCPSYEVRGSFVE